jgi:hypothetical protein
MSESLPTRKGSGNYIHQKFGAEYVFVTTAADCSFYVSARLSSDFTKVTQTDASRSTLPIRRKQFQDFERWLASEFFPAPIRPWQPLRF